MNEKVWDVADERITIAWFYLSIYLRGEGCVLQPSTEIVQDDYGN